MTYNNLLTDVKMDDLQIIQASFLLGLLSHLTFFIRGEHHKYAFQLLKYGCVALVLLFLGQLVFVRKDLLGTLGMTGAIVASILLGLFGSMAIYRVFFHRLRRFPGPLLAKVSKFYHVSQITGFDNFKFLDKLHEQYGDFVRIGQCKHHV